MSKQEIYRIIQEAIDNNTLLALFNNPLLLEKISFKSCIDSIYDLYENTNDDRILDQFIDTLREMIFTGGDNLWIVSNLLFWDLTEWVQGRDVLKLPKDLIMMFNDAVEDDEEVLKNSNAYGCGIYPNGIFDGIVHLSEKLDNEYGIMLLSF